MENQSGVHSQRAILTIVLCIHAISFALLFPVYPKLMLRFFGGKTADAAESLGWIAAMMALLKLIMNPIFGALSDAMGRKHLFILGLAMHCVSWMVLGLFPSLGVLIASKAFLGLFDSVYVLSYAMFGDLSHAGHENTKDTTEVNSTTTQSFGLVGAAFGCGLILGPVSGGFLTEEQESLPFYVASALSAIALLISLEFLNETHEKQTAFDWKKATPFPSIELLTNNKSLLLLCVPIFFLEGSSGIHTIWFLYTNYRFGWGAVENGIFLSFFGLWIVLVQGVLIRILVPNYISEWRAAILGLSLKSIGLISIGFANQPLLLYPVAFITAFDGIAQPSLRSLTTLYVKAKDQGALQGAIGSLTTLAVLVPSPVFAQIFMASITDDLKEEYPDTCPVGYNDTYTSHLQSKLKDNCGGLPQLAYWLDGSLLFVIVLITIWIATYLQKVRYNAFI